MAEITAKVVMELRGRTGCGMMDCKKALAAVRRRHRKGHRLSARKGPGRRRQEAEPHRRRGPRRQRTSAKSATPARWSRSTARPTSSPTPPSSRNCVNDIAKQIVVSDPADVDALLASQVLDGTESMTVSDMVTEQDRQDRREDLRSPLRALRRHATAPWTATSTWAARSACCCWRSAKSTTTSRKFCTTSPCRSPRLPPSLPST